MLAAVATFALEGIDSVEVTVEVDVRRGLPAFTVVGLPDPAVREARERVRAALLNSGLDFASSRITANLAPADLRKSGPSFDLALAVGVLAASGQVPAIDGREVAFCGELSLGGALRPVPGAIAVAAGARRVGFRRLVVPCASAPEAALIDGIEVLPVPDLEHVAALLRAEWEPLPAVPGAGPPGEPDPDFEDVRGQADARRALEIAATGGHSLLLVGPPGVGKTMLASRLPGILAAPDPEEALEITRIRSIAGLGSGGLERRRPFRAPHHTISASGLVGGGATPRPGELTLAHRGVLFLDEMAEFSRRALEALREPLESGRVLVTRGQRTIEFPAAAMLVGACNDCPCGRRGGSCCCAASDRARYARRLSGPLLDRIDLVCRLEPEARGVTAAPAGEASATVRARVSAGRDRRSERRRVGSGNARGSILGDLEPAARGPFSSGAAARLTARGQVRALGVARTIADLDGSRLIRLEHVQEAIGYRLADARAAG